MQRRPTARKEFSEDHIAAFLLFMYTIAMLAGFLIGHIF